MQRCPLGFGLEIKKFTQFCFQHFSLTGIFTRDISTSSSTPGRDYEPLLEVSSRDVVFERDERMKQVSIDIIDDSLDETDEIFEVVLKSDVQEQLDFPSQAEVTIKSDDGKLLNKKVNISLKKIRCYALGTCSFSQ